MPRSFFALLLLITAAFARCQDAPHNGAELSDFIRQYETERSGVSQFYELPWSPVRYDRMDSLYKSWQEKLGAVDFGALNQHGRVDYVLLRTRLEYELSRLAQERSRLAQIDELLPFRAPIQELERTRWRMQPLDTAAAATTLSAFPEQIKKLRERLEKGRKKDKEKDKEKEKEKEKEAEKKDEARAEAKKDDGPPIALTPLLARRAAKATEDIRKTLKTWYDFYLGYQPDFSWWMKKPFEETDKALDEYMKYLREELAGQKGKDDDPLLGEDIGAEGLERDLAVEQIPYSAAELLAIGEREFAWCEARMKETAREMGLGDDWKAALAKVKTLYVPPGTQDTYIAQQAADAIAFVKKNDLVTVPALCEETWRISMLSLDAQKNIPYAAYGGMHILAAYAKEDMKHTDKLMSMRGNNKHFTRIVTAHELIPGHHLQSFFAQRHRQYRGVFRTSFFVEGWALYWEMALWDKGFARSPEDKVGMLFWRMHRAARIIVSLKFHLGPMTPQQMVEFLVERVGHESFGATSEVRRFISGDYPPLYQCGYMIGGLQLRALAREIIGGGRMKEKEFHDAVLRCGPVAIEAIRATLLNVPLTRESKAQWKFEAPPAQ
ncbi:MAG TPA: DUF885 family protein [Planctomycetota bacterium]|nr:DUF885 family protein [Planctomycetota bacterium]